MTLRTPWTPARVALVAFLAAGLVGAAAIIGTVYAANPIQLENLKPGTSTWQLTNPALGHEIEGYASLTSVNRGGQIELFVNTLDATYTMQVYRLGWYGGAGAREMTSPTSHAGTQQVIPTPDATTGLIECRWTNPVVLTIPNNATDPTDWASGIYLVKLTGDQSGKQSYITFVVRDDARRSALLFQSAVTTFQAYNAWGGKSLYFANSPTGGARVVSFNRPYDATNGGGGAGELFVANFNGPGWEYNMLRWLEREGYDVTYATNVDTHADASLLLSHKAFLSVGHDEYWTWQMRDHVEAARDAGVSLGFFSSDVSAWQIRLQPSAVTGAPDRTIVGYKNAALSQDPFARDADPTNDRFITTMFRNAPVNRPETSMVGVMWAYNSISTDVTVNDAAHWAFAGTGLKNGDRLPGLLGYEVDSMGPGSPPNLVTLGRTIFSTTCCGTIVADTTIYTAPSGALVFATGSNQWAWGLDDYNVPARRRSRLSPVAQQITRNVLARLSTVTPPLAVSFLAPAPGATVSGTATVTVAAQGGSGTGYTYNVTADGVTVFAGTDGTFSWSTGTVANGTHTLAVTVTDSAGGVASASETVTVSNTGTATASFLYPAASAQVGGSQSVGMATTVPWGTSKTFALAVDGKPVMSQVSTNTTLWIRWDTTQVGNGPHTLVLTVTGANGATASATLPVTVFNVTPATFTASFLYPASSATVLRNQSVGMATTAPWGTTKTFALTVDGAAITTQTMTGTTLWVQWNTLAVPNGAHTLRLTVTDATGARATASLPVTVAN